MHIEVSASCESQAMLFIPRWLQIMVQSPLAVLKPFRTIEHYLKGYALCRRPFLIPRGCHLGVVVLSFWHHGEPFWHLEHPGEPFWHLGTTLDGHESNRMGTRWSGTGFLCFID